MPGSRAVEGLRPLVSSPALGSVVTRPVGNLPGLRPDSSSSLVAVVRAIALHLPCRQISLSLNGCIVVFTVLGALVGIPTSSYPGPANVLAGCVSSVFLGQKVEFTPL